jgi:hypothetical protein
LRHSRKAFPQPVAPRLEMIDAMLAAAQQTDKGR